MSRRKLGLLVLGGPPVWPTICALADQTVAMRVFAARFGAANGLVTIKPPGR